MLGWSANSRNENASLFYLRSFVFRSNSCQMYSNDLWMPGWLENVEAKSMSLFLISLMPPKNNWTRTVQCKKNKIQSYTSSHNLKNSSCGHKTILGSPGPSFLPSFFPSFFPSSGCAGSQGVVKKSDHVRWNWCDPDQFPVALPRGRGGTLSAAPVDFILWPFLEL